MNVNKFSLINNGYIGIKVEAMEAVEQDKVTLLDKVVRERRYTISKELRSKISEMKYFFLNLTNHWIEPFNKYFDINTYSVIDYDGPDPIPGSYLLMKSLLNKTEITGISVKSEGFIISGTIEVTDDGKKVSITTPYITEEDDVSFFLDAKDKIERITNQIAIDMASHNAHAIDYKEVAKAIKMTNIENMDEDELETTVLDKLHDRGFFVMKSDHVELPKHSKTKLHTNTNTIDSMNVPSAVEHKEEKVEKKSIGKGTLASDKDFPILDDITNVALLKPDSNMPTGGTLEDLEFSENLGIPRDEQPSDVPIDEINQGDW